MLAAMQLLTIGNNTASSCRLEPQADAHQITASDDLHQFSAQTDLGGVLGGNLASYTMITSKTGL
jgi:hypothetical protein